MKIATHTHRPDWHNRRFWGDGTSSSCTYIQTDFLHFGEYQTRVTAYRFKINDEKIYLHTPRLFCCTYKELKWEIFRRANWMRKPFICTSISDKCPQLFVVMTTQKTHSVCKSWTPKCDYQFPVDKRGKLYTTDGSHLVSGSKYIDRESRYSKHKTFITVVNLLIHAILLFWNFFYYFILFLRFLNIVWNLVLLFITFIFIFRHLLLLFITFH